MKMCSELIRRFGAMSGCMACILAAALLFCASSAYAQVMDEGGFPVKESGVRSELFSLSCPARLYARSGESVLFSCSATGVPEEGVRYEWRSVSGEGLRLLSDAQALSPVFTASLSGWGREYGYRLTATGPGVYATVSVTVTVEGASEATVRAPVAEAECGPFAIPEGFEKGCPEDKGPIPFGFGPESEEGFLFPEAPAPPDRLSGPVRGEGSDSQASPRLDCPAAVFLEELETSFIECHAWDASGEEYLEYSWEPAGGTTRDYLENPRLIPEDSPTPSVIAPETPAYETLESFRSSETTFRYRYRLTAISRATGLSSHEEVEVYVSSSRPVVYCPLEVSVEEGGTVALDCEGADPLSSRMDYDEEAASVLWEWEGLWGTSMASLDATDLSSPLFTAPAGSAGEEYHYIASMTTWASGAPRTARRRVTVKVLNKLDIVITCLSNPYGEYEGSPDFALDCWASGAPGTSYTWQWSPTDKLTGHNSGTPSFNVPPDVDGDTTYTYIATARQDDLSARKTIEVTVWDTDSPAFSITCSNVEVYEGAAPIRLNCSLTGDAPSGAAYSWTGTDVATRLTSGTSSLTPTFSAPDEVGGSDKNYDYTVTLSASGIDDVTGNVTVTVLEKPDIHDGCVRLGLSVFEGSSNELLSGCSYLPGDRGSYRFNWAPHGSTTNTDLLSATNIERPWFYVPDEVTQDEVYEYAITISADNMDPHTYFYKITVMNRESIDIACEGNPWTVYEGGDDITLNCTASGAPSGSAYSYAWAARGDTPDTALLSATNIASPTFMVPDAVTSDETYEYSLTVSAANAGSASAEVTVKVLKKEALALVCSDPVVYEGSANFILNCRADNAPADAAYSWTGDDVANRLTNTGTLTPTFVVPDNVDADTDYEYTVTMTSGGGDVASASVRVTVLEKPDLHCIGSGGQLVVSAGHFGYEGGPDIQLSGFCQWEGAPPGSSYTYSWTVDASPVCSPPFNCIPGDISRLTATNVRRPWFDVPSNVVQDVVYVYVLTASAQNADDGSIVVRVHIADQSTEALDLAVACADPGSVYEGSEDITFDCTVPGAPAGSDYAYEWTARGNTLDTSLLSSVNIASPTFRVPEEVAATTTYEYLLTVRARNAGSSSARVSVTVLNREPLAVACADPGSVYEGSDDIAFDCEASGAPAGSVYTYSWTVRGSTPNTSLLSRVDIASPTFRVPEEVAATTTYEYLLTVRARNAGSSSARVSVTVLNREPLAVTCDDPGSVHEGSGDIAFDCEASGVPEGSAYAYFWTARGDTQDTSLLSRVDIASPVFHVPDEVVATMTYEYLLTVRARNAEAATAEVSVTVLNKEPLAVACADPGSAYEGSEDVTFDCEASGAPGDNPQYAYAWTAIGDTQDTSLLSAVDIASPTFYVPDDVDETTTYEYLLTVSAENAEDGAAEVAVTVLNKEALAVACADPGSAYEGSEDVTFDCEASGAPGDNPQYAYAWTAIGDTQDTSLLSAVDIASPTFYVPDDVDETTTYEYLLTVSAENAEDGAAEVAVTVLNKEALAVACADPGSVYEGSEDVTFDCEASGAPGDNPQYAYAWTAIGDTQGTSLLSAVDIASPTFYVPDEVDETTTYEYLLTVSAENAEDGSAEIAVTVLDRIRAPALVSASDPSALGVTVSASALRFGVQSAETQVSLDPMTDRISTYVSGPYHRGRMTLSPNDGEALDENGEMDLSIELVSPVVLKRADVAEASSLVLAPLWSYAESCEQLSSQAIGGLYTEVTLSEDACRLLRFGGELDLTDVPSGQYAGNMDFVLRSGESKETHSVEVTVTVVPAQRVITIGPGGVRFGMSREVPAGLSEEQNLSIYPDVAFLTEGKPDGVFELSNPSLVPLEVSVSARFGYTEATENGREVVVEDVSRSRLGDLSEVVDIHPGLLVLMPGEKGIIRYGVKEEARAAIAEQGYAAFFDVVSQPRQYAALDRMPEEVTGERTARVTMRVPGVYVPGEGASQLSARLLSISYVGLLSATFLLETQDRPFAGEVVAYDGDGRELGRREALVYTRSRVRIPLDRLPEEGAVFLRFAPRGPGRAPLPASVEWDAPRRDIGAAGNKDRTRPPATFVQKP